MSHRRRQQGAALLLALVVLVLVDTSLVLLAASLRLRQQEELREQRELRLLALADAAVARALACLATEPDCSGVPESAFGGGTIAAEVAPIGTERRRLHAWGRWGTAQLAVEAEVLVAPAGPMVVSWRRLPPTS